MSDRNIKTIKELEEKSWYRFLKVVYIAATILALLYVLVVTYSVFDTKAKPQIFFGGIIALSFIAWVIRGSFFYIVIGKFNPLVEKQISNNRTNTEKPIENAPTMFTLNGCGSRIYGDTLYITFLFIPIIPLARYNVTNIGDGKYSFHSKLELHPWQKIWKYLAIFGIIGWIIYVQIYPNSSGVSYN